MKKIAKKVAKKSTAKKSAAKPTKAEVKKAVNHVVAATGLHQEFPTHVAPCSNPDCGDPICVANQTRMPEPKPIGTDYPYPTEISADAAAVEEVAEEVAIVSTGTDTTKKEKFQTFAEDVRPTSLTDMYDQFQKKLYLIDVSGSMNSGMAPEDEAAMYKWTPEALQKFREHISEQLAATMIVDDPDLTKKEALAEAAVAVSEMDDATLKQHVVKTRLAETAGIKLSRNYGLNTERKIDAVRGAMENFINVRFKKFPNAEVGVFVFDTGTYVKCYPGHDQAKVLDAVKSLSLDDGRTGGTNICQAVKRAISEFQHRPSTVGVHHVILVTDGEDYGAIDVKALLPEMKKLNIVFDFIYVRGQHEDEGSSHYTKVSDVLKEVCKETGGEYNEVSKSSDFKQKFFEVSNRRALPPARD